MSLASQLQLGFVRIGTEFKSIRTEILSKVGDLTALTTTSKSSAVSAINELKADLGAAGAAIDDGSATSATTTTWSANKITTQIGSAITALINGAPGALDTLKEIADELAANESAATALTTAVSNRLRFDAAQSLSGPQLTQGQSNLGVYSTAQVGDPATDFAAGFVTALS